MHKSVVRNSQYRRGSLSVRQRHNERQNMDYMNDDVIKQVSHSKKWPKQKQIDENGEIVRNAKGKAVLVNAYG